MAKTGSKPYGKKMNPSKSPVLTKKSGKVRGYFIKAVTANKQRKG